MRTKLIAILIMISAFTPSKAQSQMTHRGLVYDVGLMYGPENCSVDSFDIELVKYDMGIISNILCANAVRIEGEEIDRLVAATEVAHERGMKVFFNPWKMNAGEDETGAYMSEAAKAAQQLRERGIDLVFVAGCEYSVFSDGVFEGNSVNERLASLSEIGQMNDSERQIALITEKNKILNRILSRISQAVRENFSGQVTYSSGTWEYVDWDMFDIVGVDYYRDVQTDQQYVDGLKRYLEIGKPVYVMEVGCCAYEGAGRRGGAGFTILQGTTSDGQPIWEGGSAPRRSEKEQADYDAAQIELLSSAGIDGMFIFEFSFPIMPYSENGPDMEMTAYPIVRTFAKTDPRSREMPPWTPKEAFYRIADSYRRLAGL